MLRNNEHQFTKAFLLQPNVFGCFKSVCAQLFFFAVTFHSALLLFSPGLTILRKDKSTQISFSAQKKKRPGAFWSVWHRAEKLLTPKSLLQEVSLLGDLARKQVLGI